MSEKFSRPLSTSCTLTTQSPAYTRHDNPKRTFIAIVTIISGHGAISDLNSRREADLPRLSGVAFWHALQAATTRLHSPCVTLLPPSLSRFQWPAAKSPQRTSGRSLVAAPPIGRTPTERRAAVCVQMDWPMQTSERAKRAAATDPGLVTQLMCHVRLLLTAAAVLPGLREAVAAGLSGIGNTL